ncbi:MAG TPA: GAF domain-containing sensor histidine kinase [Spirochaetota bacterium]|nr:GAF domain-containing sensor histidine kinase [Spirochaetota bacterium]HPJ36265.1 GAF domain-containing sensor histidine kinase [Spirochaetota bacterium]
MSVERNLPLLYPDITETEKDFSDEKTVQILEHINRKVAAHENLAGIIDFIFNCIQEIIPCDRIAVSFFEEQGRRLTIHHVSANYSNLHLEKGYSADIDNSSLEKVFESGNPRIINDLRKYLESHPASDSTELLLKEGINSSITCPLSVEGRPVGLLFISSKKSETYGIKHVRMNLQIIERIGQAVEKAYRIEKLTEAIDSYMEMLSFVSHELKSPLDSIISLGSTLAGGYFGKMDDKHKDYVIRMVNKAKFLREMTSEYLTLSRFENENIGAYMQECSFKQDIINETAEMIAPQVSAKKMTLNINMDNEITVDCDINLIKIVMNNLMSNAVKYGNDNGVIDLAVNDDGESLHVSVKNTGPGFPEEAKSKLFRKFSRIETDELMKRKGTGVGLYTTWKIIQMHKGQIRADSKPGEWAEFSFIIPLKQIEAGNKA